VEKPDPSIISITSDHAIANLMIHF